MDDSNSKKPRKKGFLVPMKTADGSTPTSDRMDSAKPAVPKKTKSSTQHSDNQDLKKSAKQKKGMNLEVTANTDDSKSKEALKKTTKSIKAAPPKSLTDDDYNDLFNTVLQKVMSSDFGNYSADEEEANHEQPMKISCQTDVDIGEKATQDEKILVQGKENDENCDNDEDDLNSITSEDVDDWTDSNNKTEDAKITQPLLTPKPMIQKKAERGGVETPKQRLFPKAKDVNVDDKKEKTEHKEAKSKNLFQAPEKAEKKAAKKEVAQHVQKKEKLAKQNSEKTSTDPKRKDKKVKKAQKLQNPDLQLTKKKEEPSSDSDEETGTWIQCSNTRCHKWRYVAEIEDPILVPAHWDCKMNLDKKHNSCDLPEVDYDETEHISTRFTIGSLVWAKMDGYPWWPGMIEPDPDYDTYFEILTERSMVPFQYHVTFFDDHVSRAWIKTSFIVSYISDHVPANKIAKSQGTYKKEIQQAVNNADIAMGLSLQERVKRFGFSKRYNKKCKWRVRDIKTSKAKARTRKKSHAKKCPERDTDKPKSLQTQPFTGYHSDDSSDSSNDMADLLEDTEYKPVKTKSRGPKMPAVSGDTEETKGQSSRKMESESSSNSSEDDSDDDNDDDSSHRKEPKPGTCMTDEKSIASGMPALDPDVFTMEADSAPFQPNYSNDMKGSNCEGSAGVDSAHCELKHQKKKSETSPSGESSTKRASEGESRQATGSGSYGADQGETGHSSGKDNHKGASKSKKVDNDTDADQKENCMNTKGKKKKEKKSALKCKINDEVEKKLGQDADGQNKANLTKDKDIVESSSENVSETNKPNKAKEHVDQVKHQAKEDWKNDTKNINGGRESTVTDAGGKKKRQKKAQNKPDTSERMDTQNQIEIEENSNENCMNNPLMKDDSVHQKSSENMDDTRGLEETVKNKPQKPKNIKSECDSSKGNIKSSKNKTAAGKAKDNQNIKTDSKKRHASPSNADAKEQENNGVEVKKSKFKLPSKAGAPSDAVVKPASDANNRKDDQKQQKEIKKSKKKTKSFAAPNQLPKPADREVPQILATKDKKNTERNRDTKKKFADQHVVPDISMESDDAPPSDMDMEDTPFNKEKARPKTTKLSEEKSCNQSITDDEEEEELDLDIDVQKIAANLPNTSNFLVDNTDSDSDGMEDLHLEASHSSNKVVVEELNEGKPHIFGRFAGSCAEQGFDSDPFELIED